MTKKLCMHFLPIKCVLHVQNLIFIHIDVLIILDDGTNYEHLYADAILLHWLLLS
jgi:hypothetical protein